MPFRARDLLLPPSLLSGLRLPLAAVFPFTLDRPERALAVLLAAGASDVADGWLARKLKQETAIGAIADAISDKLFVLTVALALLWKGRLGGIELLLLGTRDLGEAALLAWFLVRTRGKRASEQRADAWGKATTFLQFASATGAVLSFPDLILPAAATCLAGAAAVRQYSVRLAREVDASA